MSETPVTVRAYQPERRNRRSVVLASPGSCCCCCCCCLHSIGAVVGAGLAAGQVATAAPTRQGVVFGWWWGSVGLGSWLTILWFALDAYFSRGVKAFNEGLLLGAFVLLMVFPVVPMVAGIVSLIGVALTGGSDVSGSVKGVCLITGFSVLGAVIGTAVMAVPLLFMMH